MLTKSRWLLLAGVMAVLPACTAAPERPPVALRLDPFYQKYADAGGIPITTSGRVPDKVVFVARDLVDDMLIHRPDLRAELIRQGARVGVMSVDETTTDLPEQSDWKKPAIDDPRLSKCDVRDYATTIGAMSDRDYWAMRARGMGGLYTTGAEENLLGVPNTRYYGENILVHEFSHNLLNAIREVDGPLYSRIETAFATAKAKGYWRGAYMALNIDEYWAEGTQFWFNSNLAYKTDDVVVVNDDELKVRDPGLYGVLGEVYGDNHHLKADVFYRHPARMNSAKADLVNDCYS